MAEKGISFGEAKAKGLVAPNKLAEQEVLKLAGGEKAFKPESWWNQQLTNQVNAKNFREIEGFREKGSNIPQIGYSGNIIQGPEGQTEPFARVVQTRNPFGMITSRTVTYEPVYKDVTVDVLKAITRQSKQSVEAVKREVAELGATKKRLSRVTGGLLAGAQAPSMGAVSSGPMLGGAEGLGSDSTLGRKTRI